jgi:cell division transport system permease protein
MSDALPPPPKDRGALLPPDTGRDRPLFIVAAILVFLACIAALGARGAWLAAQEWTTELETSLTIQIRQLEDRDTETDAIEAARIAQTISGVIAATARDRAHAEALLRPWLGQANLPDDLPLPLLVEVELEPGVEAPVDALQTALDAAGLAATVDDHGRWASAVHRASCGDCGSRGRLRGTCQPGGPHRCD